ANPGDVSHLLVFHDWLLDQGDEQGARQQAWMVKVLLGQVQHQIIFNRDGVVPQASTAWEEIRLSTRTHFLRKRPVTASCRAGKNRVVAPESFRPQKRYGQPTTC